MIEVITGDALVVLKLMPSESVQCCVTSPPYWGLRDYGVEGQLGLERTPEEYVARMVEVFREVRRVLRSDGTCWVNMGDSYASTAKGNGGHGHKQDTSPASFFDGRRINGLPPGLKEKDLCGIPWRLAFALQADGWWLRSEIIWHKLNPMPESVTDRPTKSHEQIFLLTKMASYFYDAEAVKEPQSESTFDRFANNDVIRRENSKAPAHLAGEVRGNVTFKTPQAILEGGRNKRSVWSIPNSPYSEAHFATFPPDLIKPCILAGTSARGCCPKCGAPWERVVEKQPSTMNIRVRDNAKGIIEKKSGVNGQYRASLDEIQHYGPEEAGQSKTTGWQPTCECGETTTQPCTVLDPFGGSGTTGMVALELGRKAILIELNPKYVELINQRTFVTPGLPL